MNLSPATACAPENAAENAAHDLVAKLRASGSRATFHHRFENSFVPASTRSDCPEEHAAQFGEDAAGGAG